MTFNPTDLTAIAPEIAILALALVVVIVELIVTRNEKVLQTITALGILAAFVIAMFSMKPPTGAFNGMVAHDGVTVFMKMLLGGVALLAVLMSGDYLKNTGVRHGEYYALVLLATVGMMVLASATDLVTLFIGLETMSIALYVMAGIRSDRPRSSEAALKYMLLGAFATGFLLYGMALIYGATGGKTNMMEIAVAISRMGSDFPTYLYIGVGLMMVGLLFKVAAVPFHFWSPDVYQGSPTPVTAFMSAGPKAAAFAVFIRLFGNALPELSAVWMPVLWIIAALTMTLGNIVALSQKDIKRMLAYSSIAHAGYLLLAVMASGTLDAHEEAVAGMLFYLTAYYLMNIGAFTVAILVSRAKKDGDYQIEDFKGMAQTHPFVAAAMALFMISLSGIPPTAGFFGKLYVFTAAVKADLVTLVIIAVLNSALSVYYYLRIVVYMYMQPETDKLSYRVSPAMAVVLVLCVAGILKFGLVPGYLAEFTKKSADNMAYPKSTVSGTVEISGLIDNRSD